MKYLNRFHKEAMERTMKKMAESEKSPISSVEAAKYMRRNYEIAKIMEQITEYLKTQPILKAWIFGSYARGEQRKDSDIDILILPDKSQHFSLFTLSAISEDLKNLLGREVDLVTDGGLMPFARESVDHDKVLIYERVGDASNI